MASLSGGQLLTRAGCLRGAGLSVLLLIVALWVSEALPCVATAATTSHACCLTCSLHHLLPHLLATHPSPRHAPLATPRCGRYFVTALLVPVVVITSGVVQKPDDPSRAVAAKAVLATLFSPVVLLVLSGLVAAAGTPTDSSNHLRRQPRHS